MKYETTSLAGVVEQDLGLSGRDRIHFELKKSKKGNWWVSRTDIIEWEGYPGRNEWEYKHVYTISADAFRKREPEIAMESGFIKFIDSAG